MILSRIVSPGNLEQVLMLLSIDRNELTSLRGLVVRILRALSLFHLLVLDGLHATSHSNKTCASMLTDC